MTRFRGAGDRVEVRLALPEVAILDRLVNLLSSAGVEPDDPARLRLTPRIYPEDDRESREFERLAAKERVEARSSDREIFTEGLDAAREGVIMISADEAGAWARVIGEARLVMGARSGVFEEGWPQEPLEDPEVALNIFLGHILEELVDQMLLTMEEDR